MRTLRKLVQREEKRRFSAWQIELTTRCPLRCTMCIKEGYRDWTRKDMDPHKFTRILPYLSDVKSVVLEGWGESLLYHDLIRCIDLVKEQGCQAGFVTSGMGLDEEYASRLVTAGIDFLGFSFSGATAGTHNSIRVNSDFDSLVDSVRTVCRFSTANGGRPKVHMVYLMLRDNIDEAPRVVDLAKELGVGEVVFINITQVTTAWQDSQRVFECCQVPLYEKILTEAERRARTLGVALTKPSLKTDEVALCSEPPLNNLYISVDGDVSPCVYLGPPVNSPFKRIYCGTEHRTERVSFGNIFRQPFGEIWQNSEYKVFRDRFAARIKKTEETYRCLLEMRKVEDTSLPPSPLACTRCHKILGM